jgi:1L-myo-inositol 1-phosphate cytidylyltransferase / CDP-L-myo-inositol myo-inositolphosphotransferase
MSRVLSDPAPIGDRTPGAPILVLVPPPAGLRTGAADAKILGLRLMGRMVLAARRAGYRQVVYLARDHTVLPELVMPADWTGIAALLETSWGVVIAPANALGEREWLERLAAMQLTASAWSAAPEGIVLLPGAVARDALAQLAEADAYDLPAVHERLTRRFGAPAALPAEIAPMVVATPDDARAAERRLLRSVIKDTDGFMARHVERPISLAISRRLAPTSVTPNQMSLISLAVGLAGAPFLLSAEALWQTVGALLLLAHSILDGCDGELARLKFEESRWGGVLDFWGDNIVHCAVFGCMAAGWSRALGGALPLWLGAAAILGTIGSASFVYWRVMRPKEGEGPLYTSVSTAPGRPLARLLDALSRRDFIYLVLAFALAGKVGWFLVLTAVGAPTFFLLLVVLAWREGAAPPSGL